MNAKKLFDKTKPFVRAKLLLGLAHVGICCVLLAIFMGIGWLFGQTGMVIMFLLWLGAIKVVDLIINQYFGYLVKAGHIAVIAEATATGKIPKDQINYGKARVKERFATSNVYFGVDKLVTAAVKDIQRGIERIGNKLDFIPGMNAISGLAKFFVSISLGCIDECCLGWTFLNPNDSAFKSAADGVVIYAQNWKALLKNAAKTMVKTLGLCALIALVIFIPLGLIFKLLKWSAIWALAISCLLAWVVKFAYMDSYIMIQMMAAYMDVARDTHITFDLYGKLCNISTKFKELFQKGRSEEGRSPRGEANADGAPIQRADRAPIQRAEPAQNIYCPECGASNAPSAGFCCECGTKLDR